jgi:hypothetical protein
MVSSTSAMNLSKTSGAHTPTKWEAYQAAEVLGEDVFGSPTPHPNSVLNLFAEQGIKFALPFAAYRAVLGGVFLSHQRQT